MMFYICEGTAKHGVVEGFRVSSVGDLQYVTFVGVKFHLPVIRPLCQAKKSFCKIVLS